MRKLCYFTILSVIIGSLLWGENQVKVIDHPKPLFSMFSDAKTLELNKSIEAINHKDLRFFAGLGSVTVDKAGNYYLFDFVHCTIIKLDQQFNYMTIIGRKGEGPGEFKCRPLRGDQITIGLDNHLYLVNLPGQRINKYTTEGKFLDGFKIEQIVPTRVAVDKGGNYYLPSLRGHIIDVHDPKMQYKKSFLSAGQLLTFLFFAPDPCVIKKADIPRYGRILYEFISSDELLIVDNYDLSVSIMDIGTGSVKKKFYVWDDYILSAYKIKLYQGKKETETGQVCSYGGAFSYIFIDNSGQIYLQLSDSNGEKYLCQVTRDGDLKQVYYVAPAEIDEGPPTFFQRKEDTFVGYTHYGLYVYKIKEEVKK